MAVEKQGGNGTAPANGANGAKTKRRRPSSLAAHATELPNVERSLDEFIARANETLVDPEQFNSAAVRQAEDEQRREADALRWKAAEQQMKESQAREQSLRRQLDGLQGKLAEAEARAMVAGTGGTQDGVIADLKVRLAQADEKLRTAEDQSQHLQVELTNAKAAADELAKAKAAAPAVDVTDTVSGVDHDELEQRARLAEAKAAKALAAARAAAAGLTVSSADLAAIESGLVVTEEPKKKTPWVGIIAAFVVGGGVMFGVAYMLLKDKKAPAATPAAVQPAAVETVKPTATPIETKAADEAAAAKAAEAEKAAADKAAADKAEADKAVGEQAAADKAAAEQAEAEKAAAAKKTAPVKKAPPAKKNPPHRDSGALADPFGGGGAAPKKKKEGGGGGGIVDPF